MCCRFYAWGSNISGALALSQGIGDNVLRPAIVNQTPLENVQGGTDFACSFAQGAVSCWGSNSDGQLGRGSLADAYSSVPTQVEVDGTLQGLGVGQAHVCVAVALSNDVSALW